jgi:hypothetical protein
VGQDEDPEPLVRRANLCRAEQTRRRRVAQAPKLSQDGFKAEGDVTCDVFEEHPFGGAFPDDAGDVGPEMAGIVGPSTLSGGAEGLAGISGEDGVKRPAEGAGIKAAQIIPDPPPAQRDNPCRGRDTMAFTAPPSAAAAGASPVPAPAWRGTWRC